MRRVAVPVLLSLALAGCAEPPAREYHQAEGAIEAARAAGAAEYAPEELAAAEEALTRYDAAVAERDYRQALNHALASRERASAAARKAAADKATRRGEVERLIVVLAADVERGRLAANAAPRSQEAAVRKLRQTIADTERALQDSRAALERDDVKGAREALSGLEARIAQALAPFRTDAPAPANRRR